MTVSHPKDLREAAHQQIIDVREPHEFLQEHIPGSRNIPFSQLAQVGHQLADQSVILTCRSGNHAAQAKTLLETLGCRNVTLLEGGLQGWKSAGKPTISLKKGYSIMQQVQIIAGSLILISSLIKALWFLAPIVGLGLLLAGLTNTCLMATVLSKMPWNRLPEKTAECCSSGSCSSS